MLYPISFLASLIFLSLWFIFQKEKGFVGLFKFLFFGSFSVFLISVLGADGSISYKMETLFRDFMVLSGLAFLIGLLSKNKQIVVALTAGLGMVVYSFYLPIMENTFPEEINPEVHSVQLDNNAELIIEIKDGAKIRDLESIFTEYDLDYKRAFHPKSEELTMLDNAYLIDVPEKYLKKLSEIKEAFSNKKELNWVEENEKIFISPIEGTPPNQLEKKYGVNDPGLKHQWGFEVMEVEKLYKFLQSTDTKPQKRAVIAILDSGVDANHEDIKANYLEIKKGNGKDSNGHGTHCAGIAASVTNNNLGIASLAPNSDYVQVTSFPVMNIFGFGTQESIIKGIIDAADAGVDVISMSIGGKSNDAKQEAFEEAVAYAQKAGAIVVAAAGNSNENATNISPANAKGVITVSAIDEKVNRAYFSNFVNDIEMGVAAPGVNIFSTYPKSKYKVFSGTSMACPQVSGLIGLMKSFKPELTSEEAFAILNKTGKKTGNVKETGKLIYPSGAIEDLISNLDL